MRYHYTRVCRLKSKIQTRMMIRMWSKRSSPSLWTGVQNGTATQEDSSQFLTKLNILLRWDPAIVLLAVYPNELKTQVHTKSCIWMFIAALFIIAETWKQPRCPSIGKWINKLVHPYKRALFSDKKKWGIKPWKDREEPYIAKWKKQLYDILEKTKL